MTTYSSTERKDSDAYDIENNCLSTIKNWAEDSSSRTSTWSSNQDKWHRLRMRIKKKRNSPFVGCSNIRMPTVETKIRKIKAALMNSVFGVRPIVQVIPSPGGNWVNAAKIEKFLDHLMVDVMDVKQKAIIAIDQELEKGFYLLKPHWRIDKTTRVEKFKLADLSEKERKWLFAPERTVDEVAGAVAQKTGADNNKLVLDKNLVEIKKAAQKILDGEDDFTIELDDLLYNAPDIGLRSPDKIMVPTTAGYAVQDLQYIIDEFYLPLSTLKQNSEYKGWKKSAVEKIDSSKEYEIKDLTEETKNMREGIERLQQGNEEVKIWECFCYIDINGDGRKEKCVVTLAPEFDVILRKITLPFYNGKFPFVKIFYELTDDRWYSHRGIPEIIEDIVKEIDTQHMQKIDSQTIRNTPMFLYRAGQVNPKTVQFSMGQGIPVSGFSQLKDVIAPFQATNTNAEYSYKDEQMVLESKIEECLGQIDYTLQSMINKRQPRTLGEVNAQQSSQQVMFSLDADMHREQFGELFKMIFDLWCQYGDDEYTFRYFGKGTGSQGENIKLTREECQNKYTITIRANDQNTNPQERLQKAQMILADTYQALQMGLVGPQAVMAARARALQELDVPNIEEFMIPPQPKPPAPPAPNITMQFADLPPGAQIQLLAQLGIQDPQGVKMEKDQKNREWMIQKQLDIAKELD